MDEQPSTTHHCPSTHPRTTAYPSATAQSGFTLVELLVAMVIGLLVMAGATQLFISSQQSYRFQTSLANMQDAGRFALDTLAQELRQADFSGGCAASQTTNHLRNIDGSENVQNAIQAWSDTSTRSFASQLLNPVESQHSVVFRGGLITRTGFANNSLTISDMTTAASALTFTLNRNVDSLYRNQLVLLQGLQTCEVFYNASSKDNMLQITAGTEWLDNMNVESGSEGEASALPYSVGQTVSLSALSSAIYYVGQDPENDVPPSLMRLNLSQRTPRNEIVASNVAALRTAFLIDDAYLPPNQLSEEQWENVRALRVSLIIQSDQTDLRRTPTTIATGNFHGDSAFTADDGRLYQAFTTTISLRNR
ncbi:prepilin-type N-terminal cleavage/methylation domain-containing protein [Vreelandella andesensis]|uniref:Prepilin-type N-terminal cleavage/methylation domain-containing protein n=1 Tax=Vreelandella andesensis TaxID=447567 RepID=A0A433KQW6_9GAMM|nr:PilW family protein [Halomonas andesensis]RUR31996.1 prepilin-type N-terminal cleavage/methylation domain-containing protein [Halomonas andesensis]